MCKCSAALPLLLCHGWLGAELSLFGLSHVRGQPGPKLCDPPTISWPRTAHLLCLAETPRAAKCCQISSSDKVWSPSLCRVASSAKDFSTTCTFIFVDFIIIPIFMLYCFVFLVFLEGMRFGPCIKIIYPQPSFYRSNIFPF